MCSYFGNVHVSPIVKNLMTQLGIPLPYPQSQNFPMHCLQGLVTRETNAQGDLVLRVSEGIWWYQLQIVEGHFHPNEKVTSFNAWDLSKPVWKKAVQQRRALIFATELGENQQKNRYIMRSDVGFALGAVYKDWQNPQTGETVRSCAIITRPPHPRFSQYHDKSLPLFIPLDAEIIHNWLDPNINSNAAIEDLLNSPSITTPLKVTPVRTYFRGEPVGDEAFLDAD